MGNQLSNETGIQKPNLAFGRRGALGLSRSELDKRCKPSGLYPNNGGWDERAIRKLIGDGRLAARIKGHDTRTSESDVECPICFLQYTQVNTTTCCKANLCTECFLQVRPMKEKTSVCPFCNHNKLAVTVAHKMDAQEMQQRQEEEQRAIEATIKARADTDESAAGAASDGGFGSSLEQDRRARSLSVASSSNVSSSDGGAADLVRELSMTQEDRRALEQEMKAQHQHPLAVRIEHEAAERRIENDREYYRNHSQSIQQQAALLRARAAGGGSSGRRSRLARLGNSSGSSGRGSRRNWNEIVDAFERGGGGTVNTLDDLVVLEAAMILSMEEEARRGGGGDAAAAAGANVDPIFDARQHAQEGFPLVQEFLNSRSNAAPQEQGADVASRLQSGGSDGHGGVLMRGLTEDEQMAMAIALSMQEHEREHEASAEQDSSSPAQGTEEEETGGDDKQKAVAIENQDDEAKKPPASTDEVQSSNDTNVASSPPKEKSKVAALEPSSVAAVADVKDAVEEATGLNDAATPKNNPGPAVSDGQDEEDKDQKVAAQQEEDRKMPATEEAVDANASKQETGSSEPVAVDKEKEVADKEQKMPAV